ncbi:hypothetical protein RI367_000939 [Sorochytrium milnesiophthora]
MKQDNQRPVPAPLLSAGLTYADGVWTIAQGGRQAKSKSPTPPPSATLQDVKRALSASRVTAKTLVDALGEWVDDDADRLRALMLPIQLPADQSHSQHAPAVDHGDDALTNDSVTRMLLLDVHIQGLQTALIDWLVDMMCLGIDDEDNADSKHQRTDSSTINTPRLILNQLRWLDYCEDATNMANRLLEALPALSHECKIDLIGSLSEIIPDSEQELVTAKLIGLLEDEPQLMLPILDALSNLTMDYAPLNSSTNNVAAVNAPVPGDDDDAAEQHLQERLEKAHNHVAGAVSTHVSDVVDTVLRNAVLSVDVQDVPAVVRFLMNVAKRDNAEEIVKRTRKSLDLPALFKGSDAPSTSRALVANRARQTSQFPAALLLEELRTAMRRHKHVYQAWTKALESITTQDRHTSFDIIMLFLVYTVSPTTQKDAQRLFRHKIFNNHIAPEQLRETISTHRSLFQHTHGRSLDLAAVVVALAEVLLRAKRVKSTGSCAGVLEYAQVLYSSAFETMDDAYSRQEVIGSLVTHIGSGSISFFFLLDGAMRILLEITKRDPAAVNAFAIFVRGLLDYLDNLHLGQVRQLMEVLTRLGFLHNDSGSRADNSVVSDLVIVVRKQLYNAAVHQKKIGCIGALALVAQFGARKVTTWTNAEEIERTLSEARQWIEFAHEHCLPSAGALCLLYDELSRLVLGGLLHPDIESFLLDMHLERFVSAYVLQYKQEPSESHDGVYTDLNPETEMERVQSIMLTSLVERKTLQTGASEMFSALATAATGEGDAENDPLAMVGVKKGYVPLCVPASTGSTLYFNVLGNLYAPLVLGNHLDPIMGFFSPCPVLPPLLRMLLCFDINRPDMFVESPQLGGTALLDANVLVGAIPDGKTLSQYTDLQKTVLSSSYVYALSTAKELLNAFSRYIGEEHKPTSKLQAMWQSLCQKIRLCMVLEQSLHTALAYAPAGFCPLGFEHEQPQSKGSGRGSARGSATTTTVTTAGKRSVLSDDDGDAKGKGKGKAKSKGGGGKGSRGHNSSSAHAAAATANALVRGLDLAVYNVFSFSQRGRLALRREGDDEDCDVWLIDYEVLRYLTHDLLRKLRVKLRGGSSTTASGGSGGDADLDDVTEVDVIKMFVGNVTFLCESLERISADVQQYQQRLARLMEQDDHLPVPAASSQTVNNSARETAAIESFEAIVRSITEVLTWESLPIGSNRELFMTLLRSIATRHHPIDGDEQDDLSALLEAVVSYFSAFKDVVNVLHLAVLLHQLLDHLTQFSPEPEDYRGHLHSHVASLLERDWSTSDKKAEYIEYLVSQELKYSVDSISRIREYVCEHMRTLEEASVDDTISVSQLALNPLLNQTTLFSFFKTCFKSVNVAMTANPFKDLVTGDDILERAQQLAQIFLGLITLVKRHNSKLFIKAALMDGTRFVQLFVTHGYPAISHITRAHRDAVISLIGVLQKGTRQLQNICGHSKTLADKTLLDQVPRTRAVLEQFVLAVRELLIENKLASAWWTGHLKHRDIKGQIVSSQLPQSAPSSSDSASGAEDTDPHADEPAQQTARGTKRPSTGKARRRQPTPAASPHKRRKLSTGPNRSFSDARASSSDSDGGGDSSTASVQSHQAAARAESSGSDGDAVEDTVMERLDESDDGGVPELSADGIQHNVTVMASDAEIQDDDDDNEEEEEEEEEEEVVPASQ